ncbi:MAG: hypothetical protein K9K38_21545 [Rhodoferax sp.]|nr:hypothetical protein [Rhodoferax sp.]MCF8211963.1 hypothetical protein [Rhodoferax sp.]
MVVELLCALHASKALAQGHEQAAVTALGDAATEVMPTRHLGKLPENHLHLLQRCARGIQACLGQRGAIFPWLDVPEWAAGGRGQPTKSSLAG